MKTKHPTGKTFTRVCRDCGITMRRVGNSKMFCAVCAPMRDRANHNRFTRENRRMRKPRPDQTSGPLPEEGPPAYTSSALLHAPAEIAARIINKILSGENLYVG